MFIRSVEIGGRYYREHSCVSIMHVREAATEIHMVSARTSDGESVERVLSHPLDLTITFDEAEAWAKEQPDFAEVPDPVDAIVAEVAPTLSDELAATIPWAYPEWASDGSYEAGERVCHGNVLYKVLQTHDAQEAWTPENSPSLFARVLSEPTENPETGDVEYPEWQQPDSTNAYMTGDRVTFGGKIYESLIDNNTWSPSSYPQGWKEVSVDTMENSTGENSESNSTVTISEWSQPDASNAYKAGDKVMFLGSIYESLIDGNIWSPTEYPQGWSLSE